MDIIDPPHLLGLFPNPLVRNCQQRRVGPSVLDACDSCLQPRNLDGVGDLSHRYFQYGDAVAPRSENLECGRRRR